MTVTITEFEPDREIAWTILGQLRPQIGHVYGYPLEPVDGGTLVTSYYDWSAIDPVWKEADIFPVIPRRRCGPRSASSPGRCDGATPAPAEAPRPARARRPGR